MARRKLLTLDERQALLGIPDDEESLIRHYTLSPQDRLQAEVRRRPHNQLGYAVQLCIMRYPGRVLGIGEDPPAAVVSYVAEQLGITPGAFASYARRIPTRFEHSHRVAKYLGVRTATRDDRRAALLAAAEAANATESGLPIMTAVVNELRRRGALLLPDAALEKIGLAGRAIARQRAEVALLEGLSADQIEQLEALVLVDPAVQQTQLAWLRSVPDAPSADNLIGLMDRLTFVRNLAIDPQRQSRIHPERWTQIVREGGSLSSVRADDLAAVPLKALLDRHPNLDFEAVDDVIYGCANQAGEDNRNVARMAVLLAGLPGSIGGTTMNRLCGSGMDAVIAAARAIKAEEAEIMIAGGVESMSRAPFVMPKADTAFSRSAEIFDTTIGWRFVNPLMKQQYGVDSMPETGENVAVDFGVSREDQDAFALRSQKKAAAAQSNGRLAQEIVPVTIPKRKGDPAIVDKDEHPRGDTTLEQLAKLPTPFRKDGTVTAGNASGVNDGAAALIIASEAGITKYGLEPIARIVGGAAAGVPPRIMGIGPAPATQRLCARLGLKSADFDVIELNEAFASQGIAVLRELGIPEDAEHVNPNGGAIALGHPLGMSGARIAGTAALELNLRGKKRALATMCVGVGQGIAIVIESAG